MLGNCLNLQYNAISASFVTSRHALLAPALQMVGLVCSSHNLCHPG